MTFGHQVWQSTHLAQIRRSEIPVAYYKDGTLITCSGETIPLNHTLCNSGVVDNIWWLAPSNGFGNPDLKLRMTFSCKENFLVEVSGLEMNVVVTNLTEQAKILAMEACKACDQWNYSGSHFGRCQCDIDAVLTDFVKRMMWQVLYVFTSINPAERSKPTISQIKSIYQGFCAGLHEFANDLLTKTYLVNLDEEHLPTIDDVLPGVSYRIKHEDDIHEPLGKNIKIYCGKYIIDLTLSHELGYHVEDFAKALAGCSICIVEMRLTERFDVFERWVVIKFDKTNQPMMMDFREILYNLSVLPQLTEDNVRNNLAELQSCNDFNCESGENGCVVAI